MAKIEKQYTQSISVIAEYIDTIVKECVGPNDSLVEKTEVTIDTVTTKLWTATCVYFGGRVVSLSAMLSGTDNGCRLTVHSTPGIGTESIVAKVIRKFSEKLTRIDRKENAQ